MPYRFIIGCGCAGLLKIFENLSIIDSDKLVGTFEVVRLVVDGVNYEINSIFETKEEFLDYLNDTFRIIYSFEGEFKESGELIDYENIEEFETIEVVAIITWFPLRATIMSNSNTYQNNLLIGMEIDDRIVVDNQLQQVGYELIGDPISFDPITGTVSNLDLYENSKLFIFYRNPIPE